METRAPSATLDRPAVAAASASKISAPRIGWIVIARHGEPDADRTVKLTNEQFAEWWSAYDRTGLKSTSLPPQTLIDIGGQADVVFASTLPRAIRTAESVAPGKSIVTDPVFVEAPLPAPRMSGKRNASTWGVLARICCWLRDDHYQVTKSAAKLRAQAGAATLTARALRGENVLLCGHGWFNRMMRPVLKAQGWRCVYDGGDKYWSWRKYEKRQ